MPARKYSEERIREAAKLYATGLGLNAVGKALGMRSQTLSYNFKKFGLPVRPQLKPHPDLSEKCCSHCKATKPIEDFHSSHVSKITGRPIYGWCKSCVSKAAVAWRTPEKVRNNRIKRVYGLTPSQYMRMVDDQGGRCYICRSTTTTALYVDHDHSNGRVRKLLCQKCNTALGLIKDNIEVAEQLVAYLREHDGGKL